jgi:hypothetical protein
VNDQVLMGVVEGHSYLPEQCQAFADTQLPVFCVVRDVGAIHILEH